MADFNINPLIAQYLSGLGADLMKYGANTDKGFQMENVNAVTNQSIKSNSMMKLLQNALSPDGSSVNADGKGITIKATNDSAMYKNLIGADEGVGPSKVDESLRPADPATTQPTSALARVLAGMNSGNTTGLTPEQMMSGISMAQEQDKFSQKTYGEVVDRLRQDRMANADIPYKEALTKQAIAATAENTPTVDITYGDKTMKVTPKDAIAWEKMKKETTPNEVKLYEYAQGQGYKGSIVDFKNADQTGHKKDFDEAVKSGYKGKFSNWMLEMAKAGAINLGTKVEEKKAMSELEGQLYFNNPKWSKDVDDQVATFNKDQAWLVPEKDRPLARSKVVVKSIEDKITAGSGAIQSVVMDKDNKTMIWTVKWPSGDVKIIKRAIK